MTMTYSLSDIKDITNGGFSYRLPIETIHVIQEMCDNMNVVFSPAKVRDFSDPLHVASTAATAQKSKYRRGGAAAPNDHDWELLRGGGGGSGGIVFKPTVLPKTDGFDKMLNDVRICLNKISPKNVETQYITLLEKIRDIFGLYDLGAPEIRKTATVVLDICSLNKFYSEIYANIYTRLILQYPIFDEFLREHFAARFLPSFENIKYVDGNVDYDGFCAYNKENDNRKANSMFFIQLMKLCVFEKSAILSCIVQLLELVFTGIREEWRTNEVEEITENIYIFVKNTAEELGAEREWDDIMEKIQELAQMKHHMFPSISNRAIFKYMDITD